jgi:hypothetical protein
MDQSFQIISDKTYHFPSTIIENKQDWSHYQWTYSIPQKWQFRASLAKVYTCYHNVSKIQHDGYCELYIYMDTSR